MGERGVWLMCHCAPEGCHGECLARKLFDDEWKETRAGAEVAEFVGKVESFYRTGSEWSHFFGNATENGQACWVCQAKASLSTFAGGKIRCGVCLTPA